jgi:hypothetical protein
MSEVSDSETPLKATFRIKLNGETLSISTVGHAYRFISTLSKAESKGFESLLEDTKAALSAAAKNAMLSVQATNMLRALFVRSKLV